MAQGIPFSVYGEALIICVQNFVIILMIWNYNKAIGMAEKFLTFAFFCAYAYLLFNNLLSESQWQLVSSSSTGLGFLSKCP